MGASLTRAELRTWIRLIGGIRGLVNALDRQLRDEAGMSHDDYQILSRLYRAPQHSLRMSTLAREVGFSPSRLSHAVNRMEQAGWIDRSRSGSDRRGTDAKLTTLGLEVVAEATPAHLGLVHRVVFETLGAERAGATAEALEEIARTASGES
jgi:DNA-binding MarR family transcriptional regulator